MARRSAPDIDLSRPKIVGTPVQRVEDPRLLTGHGKYADDHKPRGLLHVAIRRSDYAHARIAAIDAGPALALEGVAEVLTGTEMAAWVQPIVAEIEFPGYRRHGRDVIARDEVRFVGEAVAVVVCEDPYVAQDAIELVEVAQDDVAGAPGRLDRYSECRM